MTGVRLSRFNTHVTTTETTTKTPGYNCRLAIWFDTDRHGRKLAYYWSSKAFRAIRISVADAETFIATETADQIDGHPFKIGA